MKSALLFVVALAGCVAQLDDEGVDESADTSGTVGDPSDELEPDTETGSLPGPGGGGGGGSGSGGGSGGGSGSGSGGGSGGGTPPQPVCGYEWVCEYEWVWVEYTVCSGEPLFCTQTPRLESVYGCGSKYVCH